MVNSVVYVVGFVLCGLDVVTTVQKLESSLRVFQDTCPLRMDLKLMHIFGLRLPLHAETMCLRG